MDQTGACKPGLNALSWMVGSISVGPSDRGLVDYTCSLSCRELPYEPLRADGAPPCPTGLFQAREVGGFAIFLPDVLVVGAWRKVHT